MEEGRLNVVELQNAQLLYQGEGPGVRTVEVEPRVGQEDVEALLTLRQVHAELKGDETAAPAVETLRRISACPVEGVDADRLPLIHSLGEGGFSIVELRRFGPGTERAAELLGASSTGLCATKHMKPASSDAQALYGERLLRSEGALLLALSHPNIMRTAGCVPGPNGLPMLVTEYLPGESLLQRLRSRQPYDAWTALEWLMGISRAMAHAHSASGGPVAHRDLKLENILLSSRGEAKVCDWGLATLMRGAHEKGELPASPTTAVARSSPALHTGQTGCERYMAPENFRCEPYNETVDVFSFGILAYEVLARTRAYEELYLTSEMIGSAVANKGLRPSMPASWPESLRSLLSVCWHAEPQRRPAFAHITSALQAIRGSAPDMATLEFASSRQNRLGCSNCNVG